MFNGQEITERLQDAVLRGDRAYLEAVVSDRMIWVVPLPDNERSKREWIEASCQLVWHWFVVTIRRELDLGGVHVVESVVVQSREPVEGENPSVQFTAEEVVVDICARERGTWRLIARHSQRTS